MFHIAAPMLKCCCHHQSQNIITIMTWPLCPRNQESCVLSPCLPNCPLRSTAKVDHLTRCCCNSATTAAILWRGLWLESQHHAASDLHWGPPKKIVPQKLHKVHSRVPNKRSACYKLLLGATYWKTLCTFIQTYTFIWNSKNNNTGT